MRTDKGKQQHGPKDARKPQPDKEHGEGNYRATREYNDATREFVESGQVDEAASRAKPRNPQEQNEMHDAEQAGREKSKGEDPKLYQGSRKPTAD